MEHLARVVSSERVFSMEKIIIKIQKLLALAGSPNEHEAALALSKAQALMEEHNISMEDISAKTETSELVEEFLTEFDLAGNLPEAMPVTFVIQKLYPVRCVIESVSGLPVVRHRIFGEPSNVAVAKHTFVYLCRTFRRLWEERHRVRLDEERQSLEVLYAPPVSEDKMSFYAGIAQGIVDTVLAQRKREKRHGTPNALVVLRERLEEGFKEKYPQTQNVRHEVTNAHAFADGWSEGGKVNLNAPVSTEHQPERKAIHG
jgi:hypothetical protein